MKDTLHISLSQEQQNFIQLAKEGKNILVDACIGSGKTTAIQYLCSELPEEKKILYLTYNKLLKLDAKNKIKNSNVFVTNYHSFASYFLKKGKNYCTSVEEIISRFNQIKPTLPLYDTLIIDEYQDLKQEFADMLEYIKLQNPKMQIIAVGDMDQKIYDNTSLDVPSFIEKFLGCHEKIKFTTCFRLCSSLAEKLGNVWQKTIKGINQNCIVEKMDIDSVIKFLSKQNTKDILCLGPIKGTSTKVLNSLEEKYPDKFNKNTVYAKITDNSESTTNPTPTSAIFTTYDSSKGLERKICVICNFTESYWALRIKQPQQSSVILRNIFCVAASRGKNHIIFVKEDEPFLSEATLSTTTELNTNFKNKNFDISTMFDHKYNEDIQYCYSLLNITDKTPNNKTSIDIENKDGLIDLSPCIGIYQEAVYFKDYEIDTSIEIYLALHPNKKFQYTKKDRKLSLEKKVLLLTALETGQDRYKTQVELPFISKEQHNQIVKRLKTHLKRNEKVQISCKIDFSDKLDGDLLFSAQGLADVVKDNTVFELKFVSDLAHTHFLQCACYMIALDIDTGFLWNIRTNSLYEIKISNKKTFLDAVAKAITKRYLNEYFQPKIKKSTSNSIIAETTRLIMRQLTQEDFPALCKILQDKEVMYAYEHAFSDEEVQDWLDRQIERYEKYGFGLWAVVLKETGEIIGQCGLTMQPWGDREVLEVGYLFQKAYWHQGYATEAAQACKKYAFETLDAQEVYSIIRDNNIPSQHVAERNGMHPVGTFTKHYYNMDMPHIVYCVKR